MWCWHLTIREVHDRRSVGIFIEPLTIDVSSYKSLPLNHKLLLCYVVVVHDIFPTSGPVKVNIFIACGYMITVVIVNNCMHVVPCGILNLHIPGNLMAKRRVGRHAARSSTIWLLLLLITWLEIILINYFIILLTDKISKTLLSESYFHV